MELLHGVLIFVGDFDERDLDTAAHLQAARATGRHLCAMAKPTGYSNQAPHSAWSLQG
ncbi:hypothetical protein [Streptomyces albidochromogenes]|uniref:hypothetical protein n=1 Tax=Streptomyces albidochromogenes TaxID=329524 RepID=UPI00142E95C7|nr:hypothetical protein [Streptomyces albidochromogenes]